MLNFKNIKVMKAIHKIMIGLVLSAFIGLNANAQPKSEIPDDSKPKMNWSGADTLYTFQFDSQTNQWIYFQREVRRFDAQENPVENFVQLWNSTTRNWGNYLKINYSYDEKGNEIEQITQKWDQNFNGWVNAQLKTTTYKGNRREEVLFQEWKKPTNEWFNIMKYLISYNTNGDKNTVSISLYNGVTQNWDNYKRFNMEFDNLFAPPSTVIAETWAANNWRTEGKYNLEYNYRGDKTLETRYTWNSGKKTWLEGIQLQYIYDKKGNQTEYIERKYDYNNSDWKNFNRFTATYNELGYMIEKTEYKWNRGTSQWDVDGIYKFSTEKKI